MAQKKFWIARDKDNKLCWFWYKPERKDGKFVVNLDQFDVDFVSNLTLETLLKELDPDLFPEVTWENSPVECELVTKI